MTKSPVAAARSRRSMDSHDFKLSDSETAQKSPPSGAPTSAAAASMAVTWVSTGYNRTLAAFRGERERVTRALDLDAIIRRMASLTGNGIRNSFEVRSIADQVGRSSNRSRGGWRQQVDRSGSETDNDERTAHSRLPWPGI